MVFHVMEKLKKLNEKSSDFLENHCCAKSFFAKISGKKKFEKVKKFKMNFAPNLSHFIGKRLLK